MGAGSSPCASCKLLRRRCAMDCVFAPYFPSDDPHKFAIVHKVFGASNVSKMLQELPVHQRANTVNSLVYEANARARDPVYGCVGVITYLQSQVSQLQMQVAMARAEILCIQMQQQQQQQEEALMLVNANTQFMLHAQEQEQEEEEELIGSDESFLLENNNFPQLLNFSATSTSGNHAVYHDHMVS